jgi:peroxiredoxin Q/BCP
MSKICSSDINKLNFYFFQTFNTKVIMIKQNKLFTFLVLCVLGFNVTHSKQKQSKKGIQKGTKMIKAPDFSAYDETGHKHSLADYKAKKVVLYFYPKDFTPGCTAQACSMRDDYAQYQKHNIVILGINYDNSQKHAQFKKEYNLPFHLLTDADHSIAKAYNAAGGLVGFLGYPQRKTYLIDENGMLVHTIYNVDVATQAEDILNGFGIKE